MTVQEQALQLNKAEKLQLMEALWTDLRESEADVPSPAWHGEVLRETTERYESGQEESIDWETAKRRLREK